MGAEMTGGAVLLEVLEKHWNLILDFKGALKAACNKIQLNVRL